MDDEIHGHSDCFDFKVKNKIIEVKTQINEYIPRPFWRCEVTEKQIHREADYYVFNKLSIKRKEIFVVGFISKEKFQKKAIYRRKGDMLDGWAVIEPKYDVKISDLEELKKLIDLLRQNPQHTLFQ
jgi:hypothetical protein